MDQRKPAEHGCPLVATRAWLEMASWRPGRASGESLARVTYADRAIYEADERTGVQQPTSRNEKGNSYVPRPPT